MKRAIISVADKTGISEFAKALSELGWEIVSSGGTARFLREHGIDVVEVTEVTGFPEILSGRVKTLNPRIHGGILARRDVSEDMRQIEELKITAVDMVVCNLYPFVEYASRPDVAIKDMIEQIDIGGPSLMRAAAKNYQWVTVICKPERYSEVIRELRDKGDVPEKLRQELALEVFRHTACYDAAIASYLGSTWAGIGSQFPDELALGFNKAFTLRYGENPHQKAAYYEPILGGMVPSLKGRQFQGKEISYNNINDMDNAFHAVWDLESPGCVIVKHASPCGASVGDSAEDAFEKALASDPVSAFGGVVAFNCEVDKSCASAMKKLFLEVLVAPSFTEEALEILKKKKDLRVIELAPCTASQDRFGEPMDLSIKSAMGGVLVQERDTYLPKDETWKVVSKREPTPEELRDLRFAVKVCKYVRSNAIVLAKDLFTVGIGGGQPNRVDSVRIAVERAGERSFGSCMASDAFFPFPDSVEEAAKAGITAIAHPGGSLRDQESIDVADRLGLAMVTTGTRHFLH